MNSYTEWRIGLLLTFALGCASRDVFSEELLAAWVSPKHLLVHLHFDQVTSASRLHTSFPHAIRHLVATIPLHDVELSLTAGRWRYKEWGWPLVPVKAVGAVLDATFHSGLEAPILDAHWAALVNALSGLSCASLSLLQAPGSVSGGGVRVQELLRLITSGGNNWAEGPIGITGQRLHAMLPHEPFCTENLTPWLRLLPCRDQGGLASLLRHRHTVFGAEYVSLSLKLERIAGADQGQQVVRLVQTFTLVLRTAASPQPHLDAPPPDMNLDLESILGARVDHFCPAAIRSEVFLAEPQGPASATTWAAPGGTASCQPEADEARSGAAARVASVLPPLRRYDTLELLEIRGWALGLRLPSPHPQLSAQRREAAGKETQVDGDGWAGRDLQVVTGPGADLLVERYVTGAGLLKGGMVLRMERSAELRARLADTRSSGCDSSGGGDGGTCASSVVCVNQVFPWYVRPWMHTLLVLYDGQNPLPMQKVSLRSHLVAQQVRPAVQRSSPGVLDLCLRVPPTVAEVQLRIAFSKAFLTVFEYPPDAHRGFDVPAALVSYMDPFYALDVQWRAHTEGSLGNGGVEADADGGVASPLLRALSRDAVQQVFSGGLLVPLAAPDFSMPYNVICLSSTVLAVYFGAIVNLLTRRGSTDASSTPERARASTRGKVLQAVLMLVLFVALALYLDAELRERVKGLLTGLGFPTH
ncbi:hypothetical protein VOLCADRAFT_102993 [Volvox carteri f. nagariensis]|uniref:GPI transamidase component PIG-T n=1 Tax=Volvox carteri f. nagariensis TaxID=3068 RepID=D8TJ82_VOLCA|nr:uncharacterized protein VOLCADRAFT_102993 [Volvox carteri f. nagariensis]EFJ52494.1 hypothetical protein VOLCADRAFT_102993 [Volvox carteri f. nagariensis]|eukprot:XP_002946567.1 hypothetical protein VOLCADRAFT_102993 [Volvox carteri f. nagariensis]